MTASWLVGGLTPEAVESYASLLLALRRLDDNERTTPCQRPEYAHLWTSEEPAEREAAAWRCQSCPLLARCAAHAEDGERWHVWAGTDRTTTSRRKTA